MDYNKEEGDRAREVAMRKFVANDFAGARKFALKAQSLNPDIDGITRMVAIFAIHLAAQHIINGEMDYYGVLGVKPEADHESVKKRYKKLALMLHPDRNMSLTAELAVMLHPDRNRSVGAEEAFNFVSQAWDVVSDKAKRAKYDLKRNFGRGASSSKQANNGVQKASANSTAKGKTPKRGVKRASDASASSSSAAPTAAAAAAAAAATSTAVHSTTSDGTFWTVCSKCRIQYEYHRVYLNQNLLCPHCPKPFIAAERDPPASGSIRKTFLEHQVDSNRHLTDGRKKSRDNNVDSVEWGAVYTATPLTNPPKRRKVVENAVAGPNVASSSAPKSNSVREFSEEELRNVLIMKKAKPIILTKLQDLVNKANAGSSQNKSAIESCC